ncbi:hypothetical protein AMTRI_Chr10g233360 [Amborella trichopoda]|uniref:Auxin-responsive protein n=1 Tax=Amborella trichopoda TaxID=13333 RepID=U5DA31_AMBTC|nr:auxin response factor 18 [Amborella trichopoda]ERN19045.1 hypothetical protein AMTR_s00061p00077000 [Amborella trichopoda]|eukprot:XP_006857578.1 auxin response factor 18 [Amborella trichopoda]
MADMDDCLSSIEEPNKEQVFRSTKVFMKGQAIGRAVNLNILNSYDQLKDALEDKFQIWGELQNCNHKWVLLYIDHDGEMMIVGDDPWPEFRNIAKKILIYSREEVNRMMMPVDFGF